MKRISLTLVTIALAIFSSFVHAQTEAEMKAWQDFMQPGDYHKMMASWSGDWNEEITHYMQPGAEGQKVTVSCSVKMMMGGRFQETRHTGSFFGMDFEGYSILGYDNAKKKFFSTWLDNMGTGLTVMEGDWNPSTKTLELKGASTDPMTGKPMPMREVFRVIDNDTQEVEMYTTVNGTEFKSMAIRLTRKK